MTLRAPTHRTLWVLSIVLAGAAAGALLLPERVGAQGDFQVDSFFSVPVTAEAGDTVRIGVSNVGRRPARVQVALLAADDFSPIAQGPAQALAPGTTAFEDISLGLGSGVVAAVRTRGNSRLRISLQVIDPTGTTQVFTDGFESGDIVR